MFGFDIDMHPGKSDITPGITGNTGLGEGATCLHVTYSIAANALMHWNISFTIPILVQSSISQALCYRAGGLKTSQTSTPFGNVWQILGACVKMVLKTNVV